MILIPFPGSIIDVDMNMYADADIMPNVAVNSSAAKASAANNAAKQMYTYTVTLSDGSTKALQTPKNLTPA